MEENNWGFDESMENTSGYSLTAGINEGVTLREFIHENGQFGEQLKVIIGKGDTTITKWWALSDDRGADNLKKTIERAKAIAFHFVHAYVGKEKVVQALTANRPTNAKAFIDTMRSLLPANFQTIEASCILGFGKVKNGNQYLELPASMKVTGPFWAVNGSHELEVSERVVVEREKATEPVNQSSDDDEDWG